jgi:hypothetical protein
MQAIAERRARPNAKRFDRPYRDGPVFLHHFPALRTRLMSSTFTESLPPSPRRRFAVARPSYCGRAVARRAKVAFGLWRTGRDKSSVYNPKLLKLVLMGRSPRDSPPKKSIALKARFNPGLRNAM